MLQLLLGTSEIVGESHNRHLMFEMQWTDGEASIKRRVLLSNAAVLGSAICETCLVCQNRANAVGVVHRVECLIVEF